MGRPDKKSAAWSKTVVNIFKYKVGLSETLNFLLNVICHVTQS